MSRMFIPDLGQSLLGGIRAGLASRELQQQQMREQAMRTWMTSRWEQYNPRPQLPGPEAGVVYEGGPPQAMTDWEAQRSQFEAAPFQMQRDLLGQMSEDRALQAKRQRRMDWYHTQVERGLIDPESITGQQIRASIEAQNSDVDYSFGRTTQTNTAKDRAAALEDEIRLIDDQLAAIRTQRSSVMSLQEEQALAQAEKELLMRRVGLRKDWLQYRNQSRGMGFEFGDETGAGTANPTRAPAAGGGSQTDPTAPYGVTAPEEPAEPVDEPAQGIGQAMSVMRDGNQLVVYGRTGAPKLTVVPSTRQQAMALAMNLNPGASDDELMLLASQLWEASQMEAVPGDGGGGGNAYGPQPMMGEL